MREDDSRPPERPGAAAGPGMAAGTFRALFPVLSDLTHAASCSQGALSVDVLAALHEFTCSLRTAAAPWDAWMHQVELARARFAALIGAEREQVAITPCASEAAFQVASSLSWRNRPGLVTTDAEFPSIAHVWLGQRASGADVAFVPGGAAEAAEAYSRRITGRTHLVSVPLAGFRNGARYPAAEVAALAHERGARVFVDAYQAAGVMPVSVRELDCDYLVAGSLKYLLGVPGVAFLYVRDGIGHEREPQLTGWFGRTDPFSFDPRTLDFPDRASRFEVGTPAIPACYAAAAGLRLVSGIDLRQAFAHVSTLTAGLTARLEEAGEELASPRAAGLRGPQVAVRDPDADGLAAWLAAQRRIIAAPRGDLLRISFHYYSDMTDVAAVAAAIRDYRHQAGERGPQPARAARPRPEKER